MPAPRLHSPDELILGESMSKGSTFSAILSAPEFSGHYLSLFIGSPIEAGWSVSTKVENLFTPNEVSVVEVIGLFLRGPQAEVFVRAESDLNISGSWLEGWKPCSDGNSAPSSYG